MRHVWLKLIWVAVATTIIGCGSSSENKVPTAGDPNAPPTTIDPNAPKVDVKPGIPDLTGAAPIDLLENTTYAALETLFGSLVYGPLVGDAKLKLTLTTKSVNGQTILNGKMLFGFEDKKFWRDMTQTHFDNTGVITTNSFDIIFQDDAVVTRVKAMRTSDTLSNGKFMYRIRASTDPLVHYVYPGYWAPSWGVRPSTDVAYCAAFQWTCDSYGNACPDQNDLVTPCRQYIDTGVSGVVQVGTFDGKVSDWVK